MVPLPSILMGEADPSNVVTEPGGGRSPTAFPLPVTGYLFRVLFFALNYGGMLAVPRLQ